MTGLTNELYYISGPSSPSSYQGQFDNGILEIWNDVYKCVIGLYSVISHIIKMVCSIIAIKSLNITDIFYGRTWIDSTRKEIHGLLKKFWISTLTGKEQHLTYLKWQASNDRLKTESTCGPWESTWGPWFTNFSHVSKWLRVWFGNGNKESKERRKSLRPWTFSGRRGS